MTDKLIGAMSLCRKAGKLTMGTDPVAEKGRTGEAKLILMARDFAPRSRRNTLTVCDKYNIPSGELPYDMEEIARMTGKIYGVFAVCDSGFAKMISGILASREQSDEKDK